MGGLGFRRCQKWNQRPRLPHTAMFYQKILISKNREILEKILTPMVPNKIFVEIFFLNLLNNCSKYMYTKFQVNRTSIMYKKPRGGHNGNERKIIAPLHCIFWNGAAKVGATWNFDKQMFKVCTYEIWREFHIYIYLDLWMEADLRKIANMLYLSFHPWNKKSAPYWGPNPSYPSDRG